LHEAHAKSKKKASWEDLSSAHKAELSGKQLCVSSSSCVEFLIELLNDSGPLPWGVLSEDKIPAGCKCKLCFTQLKIDAGVATRERERKPKRRIEEQEAEGRKRKKEEEEKLRKVAAELRVRQKADAEQRKAEEKAAKAEAAAAEAVRKANVKEQRSAHRQMEWWPGASSPQELPEIRGAGKKPAPHQANMVAATLAEFQRLTALQQGTAANTL